MASILSDLEKIAPGITYKPGESYYWSPKPQTITYRSGDSGVAGDWALLHETAHALLNHREYNSDLELLMLEVAAWEKAKNLGENLGVTIDEEHIQDCLDTYRDWLHQRSTCPRCSVVSMQISSQEYRCHNCKASWLVTASRFCRPYRLNKTGVKSKSRSGVIPEATFQ
jgi:hypothetical protein